MMNQDGVPATTVQGALFAGLPNETVVALLDAASLRQTTQGIALFHQGDPPNDLLQVVSGMVKMTQIGGDGAQTTLRVMGPGELVGCVAVFQQFPYPATATTLEDTVLLSWRAASFFELLKQHPAIYDSVVRIVGTRAREMVQRVVEVSAKRAERRIAIALLRLAAQTGVAMEDGAEVGLPITRNDLAEMAAATYFTVSRTLSKWQQRGIVKSGRRRIVIASVNKLTAIAEGHES
jgi:CRP-like cAMP-binding protein